MTSTLDAATYYHLPHSPYWLCSNIWQKPSFGAVHLKVYSSWKSFWLHSAIDLFLRASYLPLLHARYIELTAGYAIVLPLSCILVFFSCVFEAREPNTPIPRHCQIVWLEALKAFQQSDHYFYAAHVNLFDSSLETATPSYPWLLMVHSQSHFWLRASSC